MNVSIFVQNVKLFCTLRGIKPTSACRESGAGKDLMSQIEKRGIIPSVDKVQKLATFLGVSTSDLLGEKKEPALVSESEPSDPLEAQLMNLVRQLSPDGKKMLIAQLESVLRQK